MKTEKRDWLFSVLYEKDLRLSSPPAELHVCWPSKGFQQTEKRCLIPPEMAGLIILYTRCVQCECLGVWVWESVLLHVCESVCQYSDWHKPRYMSRCWKNFSGMSGNELLFDWIHYTWAAIHNECCHATYLISRRTPAFQILSLNNMQKNCIFARMKRKSVFPWDVRNIIKYVIPISGMLRRCRLLLTCLQLVGNAFWGLREQMQRAAWFVSSDVAWFAWVQLNSAERLLEESPPWYGEAQRHLGTNWPLNCLHSSITL